MKNKIGIIGFGNMGSTIAERVKDEYHVRVFDKDKKKTKNLLGISVSRNSEELVKNADVVILAVKPQDFDSVLDEIKSAVNDRLLISVAAGISTKYIEKKLGKVRVVRVMPNLPARISKGMICVSKGKHANLADLIIANYIFRKLGKIMRLREDMMNEDTAVSGSGPGYYYNFCPTTYDTEKLMDFEKNYFIPSLSASAQAVGFSKRQADFLAETTAEGSRALFIEVKGRPEKLRKQVTSKGGTTAEALKVFRKEGSRRPSKKIWIKAVKAAVKRAEELSRR